MFARLTGLTFLCVLFFLTGCGQSSSVSGRVTCDGKPVVGAILFSPKGENPDNTGPAVEALLDSDGKYIIQLKTVGSHRINVRPSDIPYPPVPGKEYPCDLSSIEKEVKAGSNDISIELAKRK